MKWDKLIEELKKAADVDDQSQIGVNRFSAILSKYSYILKDREKENLVLSLPGKESNEIQD